MCRIKICNRGRILIIFKDLDKLYQDKDIPFVFKNGLQSIWLSYLTNYIITQNENLSNYFKHFESTKDKNNALLSENDKIEEIINKLHDAEQHVEPLKP